MTHPQFVPPNSAPPVTTPAFVTPVLPGDETSSVAATRATSEMTIISAHMPSTSDGEMGESGETQAIVEEAQAVLEDAKADVEEARLDLFEAGTDLSEAQTGLDEAGAELANITEATSYGEDDEYDDFVDDEIEQLRPGDLEENIITIWDPEVAERYRDAFRDIQAHFVDEPEAALGEAQDLVAEAVQALAEALLNEQVSLDPHEHDANPDTEAMRIAMRGYRDFLERVLAL